MVNGYINMDTDMSAMVELVAINLKLVRYYAFSVINFTTIHSL